MMHSDTQKKTTQLVSELQQLFSDNLLSVCVYGSSARQSESRSKDQDINVLVLLKTLAPQDLERASSVAKWWDKMAHQLPVFFSEAEWLRSQDVFALEYADIRDNHAIVYGEDLFSNTLVDKAALRLLCELELNRKLIALRQNLMRDRDKPDHLLKILKQNVASYAAVARGILRLHSSDTPPQQVQIVFQALNNIVPGFDATPFLFILNSTAALRKADISGLYNQVIQQISVLTAYVDALENPLKETVS